MVELAAWYLRLNLCLEENLGCFYMHTQTDPKRHHCTVSVTRVHSKFPILNTILLTMLTEEAFNAHQPSVKKMGTPHWWLPILIRESLISHMHVCKIKHSICIIKNLQIFLVKCKLFAIAPFEKNFTCKWECCFLFFQDMLIFTKWILKLVLIN